MYITAARNMLEHMKRDLERLGDARQRRAVLDELPDSEDYAPDFNDLATFARVFDDPFAATPRPARRRQGGRR